MMQFIIAFFLLIQIPTYAQTTPHPVTVEPAEDDYKSDSVDAKELKDDEDDKEKVPAPETPEEKAERLAYEAMARREAAFNQKLHQYMSESRLQITLGRIEKTKTTDVFLIKASVCRTENALTSTNLRKVDDSPMDSSASTPAPLLVNTCFPLFTYSEAEEAVQTFHFRTDSLLDNETLSFEVYRNDETKPTSTEVLTLAPLLRENIFSPQGTIPLKIKRQIYVRFYMQAKRTYPIDELRDVLGRKKVNGNIVSDSMSEDHETAKLLGMDSAVSENWLLKEHVLRIFQLLHTQERCWLDRDLIRKLKDKNVDIKALFPVLMVLHDIGKPLAAQAHEKWKQHEYTGPIQKRKLKNLKYTPEEIDLADALVDTDWIGDYLQHITDLDIAVNGMKAYAKRVGLTVAEYFKLQMIFYASDAGSYPTLNTFVFDTDAHGCMEPKMSQKPSKKAKGLFKILNQYFNGEDKPIVEKIASTVNGNLEKTSVEVKPTPTPVPEKTRYELFKEAILKADLPIAKPDAAKANADANSSAPASDLEPKVSDAVEN